MASLASTAQASSPFNPEDMDYWSADRFALFGFELLMPDFRFEHTTGQTSLAFAWPVALHMASIPVIPGEIYTAQDSTLKSSPLLLNFSTLLELQLPLAAANSRGARFAGGLRTDLVFRVDRNVGWSPLISIEGGGVASVAEGLGWFVGGGFGFLPEALSPAFLFPHTIRFSVRWIKMPRRTRWEITPFDFVMALPGAEWF